MAKFYLIDRTYLRANGELHPRNHEVGDTIEYEGLPGSSMIPMCAEGARAKATRDKSRPPGALRDARRAEASARARLSPSQRQAIAEAEAKLAKP